MLRRHKLSFVFISLYFLQCVLLIKWFTSGVGNYPSSCGAANGALIILFLLTSAVYFFVLLVKILVNHGHQQVDYLKILLINFSPPILLALYAI